MYRKFKIEDEEGETIKFKVFPNLAAPSTNLIQTDKYEIDLTLPTQQSLSELIVVVNKFMSGNTINKVEVTEVE